MLAIIKDPNATVKQLSEDLGKTKECTVVGWDSMGRVMTQTHGLDFQTLGRAFSFFLNLEKLGGVFQKLA